MKPEVAHGERRTFTPKFTLVPVKLIVNRGAPVAQAANDLDLHEKVLREWARELREALQSYWRRAATTAVLPWMISRTRTG